MHVLNLLDQDGPDASDGSFGAWLYRVAWLHCAGVKTQWPQRYH